MKPAHPHCALFIALSFVLTSFLGGASVTADDTLGIGSKAPSIDVEHWIQNGNGFFKPIKTFEKDKVYVIEFWATWCQPCIMSMPHLAELQNQYRGENVQIISISNEDPDEIKQFLTGEAPSKGKGENAKPKTFEEVTSAYSLTTDPDGSVYHDYMAASDQQGIPTAFIVGKDSKVEWIGHPMEMDEPLAQVVKGTWDREAFLKEVEAQKEIDKAFEEITQLATKGKFDEAIALVDEQMKKVKNPALLENLTGFRASLMLSSGKINDEVIAFYRSQMKLMKEDWRSITSFGYSLTDVAQQGGKVGPLARETVEALKPMLDQVDDPRAKPVVYHILARLSAIDKKMDEAISFQEKSVEMSEGQQKARMQEFLDGLTKQKEE